MYKKNLPNSLRLSTHQLPSDDEGSENSTPRNNNGGSENTSSTNGSSNGGSNLQKKGDAEGSANNSGSSPSSDSRNRNKIIASSPSTQTDGSETSNNTSHIPQKQTFAQRFIFGPLMSAVMWLLVHVFFREVAVVGLENVPKEGGVLFYGNHQNQFVDAMMMRAHAGRNIRMIIAEKSTKRPVVGQFSAAMNCLPVTRPQDVPSEPGNGIVTKCVGDKVYGKGSNFKAIRKGDVILFTVPNKEAAQEDPKATVKVSGQVTEIFSETELQLTQPLTAAQHYDMNNVTSTSTTMVTKYSQGVEWKISRRIDNSALYGAVFKAFENGEAVGIFPEGGSHDRTSLLPLKAGVASFTLGAAEKGIKVTIIPVGLTYFYGHKFRSRAHIEFGKPLTPPKKLVESYSTEKRETTQKMLDYLAQQLTLVTIQTTDWATMKFLHSFRRLYQPLGLLLDTKDYLRLTRRLALIISSATGDEDFTDFRQKVENYSDLCNALFIKDAQTATLSHLVQEEEKNPTTPLTPAQNENPFPATLDEKPRLSPVRLLFRRLVILYCLTLVLLPFFILMGPLSFVATTLAVAHARTALRQSTVKVVGSDVQASYKIIFGFAMIPLQSFVVSGGVWFYSDLRTAVTVLLALPAMMYVSLPILREWVMEVYAAFPLLVSMVTGHKQFRKLYERRCELVTRTKKIVNRYDSLLDQELEGYRSSSADGAASLPKMRQASLFSLRHHSHIVDRKTDSHKAKKQQ